MTTPNKTELLASLADNEYEIKEAVAHLSGTLSKKDWNEALQAIYKLKALQSDIEYKLRLLADQSRT